MNRHSSIHRLQRRAILKLARLSEIADSAANLPYRPRVAAGAFVVNEAHNVMAGFLRGYYLSSATGGHLKDGTQILSTVPIRSQREALEFVILKIGRTNRKSGPWSQRDEPVWHQPRMFLRALRFAGCSNTADAEKAFSVSTKAFEDLTVARNFYSHRNDETALKVRRLAKRLGLVSTPPVDVVFSRAQGRPQAVVEDWLTDLRDIFSLLPS